MGLQWKWLRCVWTHVPLHVNPYKDKSLVECSWCNAELSPGCIQNVYQQHLPEAHDLKNTQRRTQLWAISTQPRPRRFPQQVCRHSSGAPQRLGDQNRPAGQSEHCKSKKYSRYFVAPNNVIKSHLLSFSELLLLVWLVAFILRYFVICASSSRSSWTTTAVRRPSSTPGFLFRTAVCPATSHTDNTYRDCAAIVPERYRSTQTAFRSRAVSNCVVCFVRLQTCLAAEEHRWSAGLQMVL